PSRPEGTRARGRRALQVAPREPDQQRRPGGSRGDVQPDDLLLRNSGDRPQRRLLGLRREQLRLRHEGLRGELRKRPYRRESRAVERRPGADAFDLRRQLALLERQLLLEREPLDIVHVAILTTRAGCRPRSRRADQTVVTVFA